MTVSAVIWYVAAITCVFLYSARYHVKRYAQCYIKFICRTQYNTQAVSSEPFTCSE